MPTPAGHTRSPCRPHHPRRARPCSTASEHHLNAATSTATGSRCAAMASDHRAEACRVETVSATFASFAATRPGGRWRFDWIRYRIRFTTHTEISSAAMLSTRAHSVDELGRRCHRPLGPLNVGPLTFAASLCRTPGQRPPLVHGPRQHPRWILLAAIVGVLDGSFRIAEDEKVGEPEDDR